MVKRTNGTISLAVGTYDRAKLEAGVSMHEASRRSKDVTLTPEESEGLKAVLNPLITPLLAGGLGMEPDYEGGGSGKKRKSKRKRGPVRAKAAQGDSGAQDHKGSHAPKEEEVSND